MDLNVHDLLRENILNLLTVIILKLFTDKPKLTVVLIYYIHNNSSVKLKTYSSNTSDETCFLTLSVQLPEKRSKYRNSHLWC